MQQHLFAIALAAALAGPAHAAASVDCAALLAEHERTDLDLSYEKFDQTEDSGFRVLAKQGCNAQAERLILAYRERHAEHASPLWWHAAQQAASAGDYARASAEARHSLEASPPGDSDPLMWDDYVLASIAFFDRDKAGLQRHRDRIAATGLGFWGNRLNVNLLDTMLAEFDASYDTIGVDAMKKWKSAQAEGKASWFHP
jgi:hypothetical protein